MTVLSVAQSVARYCGVGEVGVQSLFTPTSTTDSYFKELMDECARRITMDRPWQLFSIEHTITGDGATVSWDLPSDYDWMRVDQELWTSSLQTSLIRIESQDDWLRYDTREYDLTTNRWIVFGGQIHIKPALAGGTTVKFFYQSNKCIISSADTLKASFTADTDVFRLPERLLKLCGIWQYKADRSVPYAEDMENYEQALAQYATRDEGPKIIAVGRPRMPRGVSIAYPKPVILP